VDLLTSKKHINETLFLCLPVVATQIGHIITGMVDNIFLGQLGKTEQAAGILANNVYVLLLVFSIGVSYASTPLVSAAHVSNDVRGKASLFKNSLVLNTVISVILFLILFIMTPFIGYLGQPEDVVVLTRPYIDVLIFSIIPVSVFFTCKQYAEGLSNTKAAMYISIIGNLLNIILNYCMIYGKYGFPELNYMGSVWATFIARCFMAVSFLAYIFYNKRTSEIRKVYSQVRISWEKISTLAKIGLNAGLQFTFEVAAFAIAGFMAGVCGKEQIDAHGITLGIAAFTYMFASGISSASTIRVGNYFALNDKVEVRKAGNAGIVLVLIAMAFFAIIFIIFNHELPKIFSTDEAILKLSAELLIIAALFQLFDGLQVTSIGILRGMGDVKYPTWVTLIGYWAIALPLAYYLAFVLKMEVVGIWYALLISLIFVGIALFMRYRYLIRLPEEKITMV
jgi:multidrug resistance protein, MATE family